MNDDVQQLLGRFGREIRSFLERAGKSQHSSNMFDLQRRTLIGCYCYFDHLAWALDLLEEETTPGRLGKAARGLCGLPTAPYIHGLLWGYLVARENEIGLGRDRGDERLLERLLTWWSEVLAVYRADGTLLPHEAGYTQPAAPPQLGAEVLDASGHRVDRVRLGRLTAGLQLYNFTLHGEQRGTTYFHGPYPSPDTRCAIVVEEFTALRHNRLPWSPDPTPLPVDTVAAILEVEGVEFEFDLFAGMSAIPNDYLDRVRRGSLVTCDEGPPRPLAEDEIEVLIAGAAGEQWRIFKEQLQWDADFRIVYGIYHYLDVLAPFFATAGVAPEAIDEARSRFEETASHRLGEIRDLDPIPAWDRLFARGDSMFTPLQAAGV